ncbi:PorT family protein [Algibacter pacificus]|uniref:PorT family protein n=1 Tax=Algibacter pacificus TaxID=2599389 RepID=UPI0011CC4C69|nr:PorT family protein [Algibacter pacificus]
MKETLLILCIIYPAYFVLNAQDKTKEKEDSFEISDQVNINKTVLPFSSYFSEYRLNDNWIIRAENIETNFGGFGESYGVKEFPLLAKYSFAEKFSVLFGATTNLLFKNGTIEDVSTSATLGVQYDVNESLLMEARFNYNLSNDSPFKQSLPSTNSLFKLGAKYKF